MFNIHIYLIIYTHTDYIFIYIYVCSHVYSIPKYTNFGAVVF